MNGTGYIYRMANASAAHLFELVRDYVGLPCWTFGGASLWDVDPARKHNNLRPITSLTDMAALDTSGDFGHAFAERAEVRWKRLGHDVYDVLVLSEQSLDIAGARPVTCEGAAWQTEAGDGAAIVQTDHRPRINYILYRAPNAAVELMRYMSLEPEGQA